VNVWAGCLFCKIARGEAPASIVNRAEGFLAFEDIAPKADVHLLVIPEKHIDNISQIGEFSADEVKRMLEFAVEAAHGAGLEDFRLITFNGRGAGQTVFHLHWHVLGGEIRGMPA
jgi:histidine triad (HIT) family protein